MKLKILIPKFEVFKFEKSRFQMNLLCNLLILFDFNLFKSRFEAHFIC